MGLYDYINFKMNCPRCKKDMGEFQSKDGDCGMETLDWWEVDNFYTSCEHCRTWVEFTLGKRPNRKLKISDYDKSIEKTTGKDDKKYKAELDKFLKHRVKPKLRRVRDNKR